MWGSRDLASALFELCQGPASLSPRGPAHSALQPACIPQRAAVVTPQTMCRLGGNPVAGHRTQPARSRCLTCLLLAGGLRPSVEG